MDRQEHHGHPAPGCRPPVRSPRRSAPTVSTNRPPSAPCVTFVETGFGEDVERLSGIGVSPGIAAGPAVILTQRARLIRRSLAADGVNGSHRFHEARETSRRQLHGIKISRGRRRESSWRTLFDAQILMLDDPLPDASGRIIRERRVEPASGRFSWFWKNCPPSWTRSRYGSLRRRQGRHGGCAWPAAPEPAAGTRQHRDLLRGIEEPCVLIADRLTPSLVAQLDWTLDPRICHRLRHNVSHGHHRAIAPGAGGGRPARRDRTRSSRS